MFSEWHSIVKDISMHNPPSQFHLSLVCDVKDIRIAESLLQPLLNGKFPILAGCMQYSPGPKVRLCSLTSHAKQQLKPSDKLLVLRSLRSLFDSWAYRENLISDPGIYISGYSMARDYLEPRRRVLSPL